ncbi:MAG: hypothetical protein WHS86_05735 [Desulfosoma sp.]
MDNVSLYTPLPMQPVTLGAQELTKAVEHLYGALRLIERTQEEVCRRTLSAVKLMEDLAEAWYEINKCRIYTEKIVDFEEMLQPAMGYVNDARCMVETVADEEGGMTESALSSILGCLWEAAALVHCVLEELESWMSSEEDKGS